MQKQIKILLTLLTVSILAVSCAANNPNNPIGSDNANFSKLKKNWIDSYKSVYSITENEFKNLYLDNNTLTYKVSYSTSILEITWNPDNTSGIIYGQYTINNNNQNDNGKYYAISFQGLTDNSVSISGAGKFVNGSYDSSAETLEEAKTKFTVENGYFSFYSDCTVSK